MARAEIAAMVLVVEAAATIEARVDLSRIGDRLQGEEHAEQDQGCCRDSEIVTRHVAYRSIEPYISIGMREFRRKLPLSYPRESRWNSGGIRSIHTRNNSQTRPARRS